MSVSEFRKRLIVNSRCDPELAKLSVYNVYTPPTQMNTVPYSASSAVPGSLVSFNVPINSPGILSKDMYIRYVLDINLQRVADTSAGGWASVGNCNTDPLGISLNPPIVTELDGMKAWNDSKPLNALCSWSLQRQSKSANITLNGASITTNMQDYLNVFESLLSEDEYMNGCVSTAPVMRDNGQSFQFTAQKQKNPLQRYADSSMNVETRGGSIKYVVLPLNRSQTNVTVRAYVCEKLIIQPLASNKYASEMCGFVGIQNLQIQLNLNGAQNLIWSCNGYESDTPNVNGYAVSNSAVYTGTPNANYLGVPPSQITYNFVGGAGGVQLLLQTYSPPSFVPMEGRYFYDYSNVIINSSQSVQLTTTATQVSGASFNLTGCPRYIAVYVKRTNPSPYQPNVCGIIDKATFTIGNQSGLLSNADQNFLMYLSQQSGSLLSWPEFSDAYGSVVFLDVGKVLPMNDMKVVGENCTIMFQCNATCRISPYETSDAGVPLISQDYQLYYAFLYESMLEIDYSNGGSVTLYQSIITENDRRELFVSALESYTNSLSAAGGYLTGGSWYSSIVTRMKNYLRPKVQKLKDLSDIYGNKFDKTLGVWKDDLPSGIYDTLSSASQQVQEAINDAHRMIGQAEQDEAEGKGGSIFTPSLLWVWLAKKYGPAIVQKVKQYLQSLGVIDGSGARFTRGRGIGPSAGIGGRRLALRR